MCQAEPHLYVGVHISGTFARRESLNHMSLRLVGLVLVAACGGSPAVIAPPPPVRAALPPIVPSIDLTAMFALPTPSIVETRCRTFPVPAPGSRGVIGGMRRVVYDFMEMPLGAIERGPRTNLRERRRDPMTTNDRSRPFSRRAHHITQCWKWFAATHPGGDTQLDVQLAIDAFGATGDVTIANRLDAADLAACVRDAFAAPMYIYGARTHEQRTSVTIHFERADQPPWPTPPARPSPIAREPVPARGTVCARVQPGVVDARLPPKRVTDFDAARIPPPPPGERQVRPPSIRVGCVSVSPLPRKANIRTAVVSNWGAYEACHAEARARMPDLGGTVVAKLLFDTNGAEPTLASVSGAGDAELHACLDRALEEIWLDPPTSDTLIEANIVFPLVTDLPPPVRDAASWRTAFATATSPLEGCRVRHELVTDRLLAAPWVDDARVRAAVGELARYIAALAPADRAPCLAEVASTLHEYAGVRVDSMANRAIGVEARLDRLETVLPLASIVDWGPNLRWMIALAYRAFPARAAESERILAELALDPTLGDAVRADESPGSLENPCPM